MNKLEWALLFQVIASLFAFFQLQGHYVWTNLNFLKSMWWVYATSLIIAPLFWYSTKWSYEHFGQYWNIRLMGFGMGTVVFGFMTWLLSNEIPTIKTFICILLAIAIILIQITNVADV